MILLLDNFDSFTHNLLDYFSQVGIDCKLFRNNTPVSEIKRYNYEGIVLSPGPGVPKTSGCMMEVIDFYYKTHPMLGVCLGHQGIGEFFGATLKKAIKPMHGKISQVNLSPDSLFKNIPHEIKVVRYHSLIIDDLPEVLEATAVTNTGEIMAVRHKELPIFGLQFHPEAVLTEYGLIMLDNWVRFNIIAAKSEKISLF